jgi:hypothetical protein
VILLLEHADAEGSSGLVINCPTPLLIANLGLEEDIAGGWSKNRQESWAGTGWKLLCGC